MCTRWRARCSCPRRWARQSRSARQGKTRRSRGRARAEPLRHSGMSDRARGQAQLSAGCSGGSCGRRASISRTRGRSTTTASSTDTGMDRARSDAPTIAWPIPRPRHPPPADSSQLPTPPIPAAAAVHDHFTRLIQDQHVVHQRHQIVEAMLDDDQRVLSVLP